MSRLKKIEGYDGYFISDEGEVFSSKYKEMRLLKHRINRNGRPYVNLSKNGKQKSFEIHRLVAKYFLSNYDSSLEVNHIDGVKTNNCVNNLEMVTRKENINHAFLNNLKINPVGEEHWDAKLTEQEVKEIREKYVPYVYGAKRLAKEYGVTDGCIKFILKRKTWKHI